MFTDFDRDCLAKKIIELSPKILCFNGKKAAQVYLRRKDVKFGYQDEVIGGTKIFVAPSTSGSANRYWDIDYWFKLAGKSNDLIINIDADAMNADWAKRTWDLPPYKSPEFMNFLRFTGSTLDQFRNTPVY